MNKLQNLRKIVSEITYMLTPKQKKNAIWVFASMILCSLLELLGVSAIYPFLELILDEGALTDKWYMKIAAGIIPNMTFKDALIFVGVLIMIIYLLKNLAAIGCAYVQESYASKFQREFSTVMLDSYMKRPYEYFSNTNSSVMIRGVSGDTNSVYTIIQNLFTICAEMLTITMIGIYLVYQDLPIALGALGVAFLCFLGITTGFKGAMKRNGVLFREANAGKSQCAYEAITGIKEITVSDRRSLFVGKFEKAAKKYEKATRTQNFLAACPDRILEGVCIAGIMGVIIIRLTLSADNEAFIPVLGTFAMGAFKVLPSVSKLSSRMNSIIYHQPAMEACYENVREARRLDAENYSVAKANNTAADVKIDFEKEIKIDNISWHYKDSEKNVLDGLSLTIEKGQSIALIGSSGAGKTTLADILMGLYKPQSGSIKMDDYDIYTIPHQWAKIIGYVPQAVFLIDDTVRANVGFGLPEDMISDEKIWHALEQAQLAEFVRSLPNGLDTLVGERGVKFSGGQRQRIAIARALYENPEIIILDEATAALDNETETAVMESIDALQGTKTMIIVAHRLTTIRNCDKIYEIGGGVATERKKEEVIQ